MLRRTSARLTAVLTAATAALALAACGSGASSTGSSSTAASGSGGSSSGGVLRVATEGTYAPFTYHDPAKGNALTGYDVDVARAVGADLGMQVQFTDVPFDAIFAGLQADRYDVIANQVTPTAARQQLYDFSTPYTTSTGAIMTKTDNTSITSLADLAGKTTAQSSTSNWAQVATAAGAQVQSVEGFTQAVALVKQGRVDATVNDDLAFLTYEKTTGDTGVKIAAKTPDTSHQALALRKGSPLTAQVDKALADLRANGTLTKLSEQYFGQDVSQ